MKSFFLILLSCALLRAGDEERIQPAFPLYFQAMNMDAYHSLGFSDMLSAEPADLASSNPAAVNNFTRQGVGISYAYGTKINFSQDIYLSSPLQWLPSSFGYIFPFGNYSFAVTYHRKYDQFIDYGKIEISTIEHPEGTGVFIHSTSRRKVHSFSVLFGYSFRQLFTAYDKLSFGLQTYVDYLDWKDQFGPTTGTSHAFGWSGKLGLIYEMKPSIGFGLFYERGTNIKSRLELDPPSHYVGSDNIYQLQFADKIALGVRFKPVQNFTFAASLCGVLWNWTESAPYRNQLDVSLGSIYSIPHWFDISFGLYSSRSKMRDYDFEETEATYLNFGLRKQFGSSSLQIELFDSSHSADKIRRHSVLRVGFNQTLFSKR